MEQLQKFNLSEMQSKLSTLWIFFLLNMIFRDIHEFAKPEFVQEAMTGFVNGNQVTEEIMLIGGFMVELLILMVLLSRILPYRYNRWTNIIIPPLAAASLIFNGVNDMDDIFFTVVELITLGVIIWLAYRWPDPQTQLDGSLNRHLHDVAIPKGHADRATNQ